MQTEVVSATEIIFIRRMLGFTQDEMCRQLNVSKQTLSQAEKGKISKTLVAKLYLTLTKLKNSDQQIRRAQLIAINDFLELCENQKL
jgi:DNA-binding XRE family transcriptional regulator